MSRRRRQAAEETLVTPSVEPVVVQEPRDIDSTTTLTVPTIATTNTTAPVVTLANGGHLIMSRAALERQLLEVVPGLSWSPPTPTQDLPPGVTLSITANPPAHWRQFIDQEETSGVHWQAWAHFNQIKVSLSANRGHSALDMLVRAQGLTVVVMQATRGADGLSLVRAATCSAFSGGDWVGGDVLLTTGIGLDRAEAAAKSHIEGVCRRHQLHSAPADVVEW